MWTMNEHCGIDHNYPTVHLKSSPSHCLWPSFDVIRGHTTPTTVVLLLAAVSDVFNRFLEFKWLEMEHQHYSPLYKLLPIGHPWLSSRIVMCYVKLKLVWVTVSLVCTRGDPRKPDFLKKKKIYLHFEQKTLNPLQNTLHWRQYTCPIFFPTVWSISGTAEAWCCWVPPAKLFSPHQRWQISFQCFFHCQE
jgi:hypothetical protein